MRGHDAGLCNALQVSDAVMYLPGKGSPGHSVHHRQVLDDVEYLPRHHVVWLCSLTVLHIA